MTLENALQQIKENWATYPHDTKDNHEAVWIAMSDLSESYEIDEEWIGMKSDGSLVWAYASGCSCWEGEYDSAVDKTIKAFKFSHENTTEQWERAIIDFAGNDKKELVHISPEKK